MDTAWANLLEMGIPPSEINHLTWPDYLIILIRNVEQQLAMADMTNDEGQIVEYADDWASMSKDLFG